MCLDKKMRMGNEDKGGEGEDRKRKSMKIIKTKNKENRK